MKHSFGDADSINEKGVKLGQNFHIFACGKQTDERIWMNWTTFHAEKIGFHLKKLHVSSTCSFGEEVVHADAYADAAEPWDYASWHKKDI